MDNIIAPAARDTFVNTLAKTLEEHQNSLCLSRSCYPVPEISFSHSTESGDDRSGLYHIFLLQSSDNSLQITVGKNRDAVVVVSPNKPG